MGNKRIAVPMQIGEIICYSKELQNLIADFGLELKQVIVPEKAGNISHE